MGHGRLDQGLAGGEVVQHRPARQARGVGDHRIGRGVIADLGDQTHRLVENPRPGLQRLGRILGEAGGVHDPDLVQSDVALQQPAAAKLCLVRQVLSDGEICGRWCGAAPRREPRPFHESDMQSA
jgi:hypothetical protein